VISGVENFESSTKNSNPKNTPKAFANISYHENDRPKCMEYCRNSINNPQPMVNALMISSLEYFSSVLMAHDNKTENIKYIEKWTTLSKPLNLGTSGKSCIGSKDKAAMHNE
jgi:hypothetical protein